MIREFTLESLQGITNNFSEEHKIGAGGYGKVYKGVLDNGEEIVLKRLHYMPELDDTVFRNEFSNLMKAQHKNITRLVGYCFHTGHQIVEHKGVHIFAHVEERVLCLEYLQNGSLDNYLSDESSGLDWHIRYKIINGVCEGLNFLHNGNKDPIYHMDLKPANILLDQEMTPKIGDFGLSRLFPTEHTFVTTKMIGTRGYMPPEYIERGEITNKFDVFSLGVIIIKVIAGDEGYSTCPSYSTQEFVEYVHENWRKRLGEIMSSRTSEEVITCLKIALQCVEVDRVRRPTISEVVTELNKINSVKSSPISEHGGHTFEDSNDELIKDQRVIPEKEKPLEVLPTEETHVEQLGEQTCTEATTSWKAPDDYDFLVKLLLIGDSGVGKSCLLLRFSEGVFTTYLGQTLGVDFKTRTVELDGKRVRLQMWDTSGTERLRSVTNAYHRGVMGILLFYDVTDESSFNNIRNWKTNVKQHASPDVNMILVGNITDLDESRRVVTTSTGQALADEYGIKFFETCTKTNLNVDQVFISLTREIIKRLFIPKETKVEQMGEYDFSLTLLLIGDSGVGKSNLLSQFSEGVFTTSLGPTIGIDFKVRKVELDGKRIKLQVWDTAGQERFRTITSVYYKRANAILLVYDVTDESSFNNIRNWKRDIEQRAPGVKMILVGNKIDVDESERVVTTSMGQALAGEYGIKFFETCAKTNLNVDRVFFSLTRAII